MATTKIMDLPVYTSKSWRISKLCPSSLFWVSNQTAYTRNKTRGKVEIVPNGQEIFLRVEFAQNDTQNIDPDSIRTERILSYRALDRDKFAHY